MKTPSGKTRKPARPRLDAAECRRLLEEAQQKATRDHLLFEATPDAVLILDANGAILNANMRAVTILGYAALEDLIGQSWLVGIFAEDRDILMALMKTAMEERRVVEHELKIRRRDGDTFFGHGRMAPVLDPAAAPFAFVAVLNDISEKRRIVEALRTSQEMLRNAERISHVGSWQWDFAHGVQIWSDELSIMMGRAPDGPEPELGDFLRHVHREDLPRVNAVVEAAQLSGELEDMEFRIVRPDGAERVVFSRSETYRDGDGRPVRLVGTVEDITERRTYEHDLSQLNGDLMATVERMQQRQREMILINEFNETMQTCNAWEEAYPIIAATGRELFPRGNGALATLLGEDHELKTRVEWGEGRWMLPNFLLDDCWALRRGQPHDIDNPGEGALCHHFSSAPPGPYLCLPLTVHGETLGLLHCNVAVGSHIDQDERELLVTFSEIVKLSLSNLALRISLREQAIRDPLTGLFNRLYLEETLMREAHRARRQNASLSVAMFDIDNFKLFNDHYGHGAGDEVLRGIGELLRAGVRESDIACRYGGEEFLLILLDTQLDTAMKRLQAICDDIRQRQYVYRGERLPRVTVSVGLAQMPMHGVTPEELLKASDDALYAAKRNGRDRIEIHDEARAPGPDPGAAG